MMTRSPIPVVAAFSLILVACDRQPIAPDQDPGTPQLNVTSMAQSAGAIVTNPGVGTPSGLCNFGSFLTNHVTALRTPNGTNLTLMCQFDGLPPISRPDRRTGFQCNIIQGGINFTNESTWQRSPAGQATLTCHFDREPAFDAKVAFAGEEEPAAEGAFTTPLADFPDRQIGGEVVFVGRACSFDLPLLSDPSGKIALIERGACRFDQKIANVVAEGAIAAIVFNDAFHGDALITMGGNPRPIPGVMVEHSTGLSLIFAAPVPATLIGCRNPAAGLNGCQF